ncbi:FecR domain-containing protein [bacterium]|nr:FecR domain-containing protein [bacterium]
MHWHAPDDLTLQQYLDSSLGSEDRQAFSEHLKSCTACQAELQAARRLEQLSQSWQGVDPPAQLLVRVQQQLRPQSSGQGWLWAAAAAALIGFGLGRGLLSRPEAAPQLGQSTPATYTPSVPQQISEQHPRMPLSAQQIWTTGDSPSVVAFSGQILNLAPRTRLEVASQEGSHYWLRLRNGQVRVQEHGQVIAIETEHLRVEPLGTDYQVSLGKQSTQVYLYSGRVRVSGRHGELSILSPGQKAEFPAPLPGPALTQVKPEPAAVIPGPAYPQRTPTPHPQPPDLPPAGWQPGRPNQPWRPIPEIQHRPRGGPPLPPWQRR